MSNKITTKLINAATACLLLMYFAFVPACGIAEAESLPPLLFRNISFGSVGEDVRSLQRYLNENGYPVALSGPGSYGSETLFFGYATRTALAKFQVAHGLPGTGYAGNSTKTLFNNLRSARASQDAYSILSARIEALKAQIASLQQLLNYYQPESGAPFISSIRVYDGGDEGYIDVGDYISITFNEPIDPESVNRNLDEGDYVRGIDYWETGGVSVSSAGKVTIKGIASFDMGSVEDSGKFTSKLALSSTGKILTITLTSGSDIEIRNENFTNARQAGGIIEDEYGNSVLANVKINNLKGTFGRENGNDDDSPYISSIRVYDGGDEGYIDVGDYISITFNEPIDPESVNRNLDEGDYVRGIDYWETGGVSVSSSGTVAVRDIAFFDMGSVEDSGDFVAKEALSSNGRVLTITLTSGSEIKIRNESFDDAAQVGGTIENRHGNEMKWDSSINDPTGTFGGKDIYDDDDSPYISSIRVYDGGDEGYIDVGDYISITFNEPIDPESVNDDLVEGGYIEVVDYWETGGVSVSGTGKVTIENIASFDTGSVEDSGDFNVRISLSSNGEILRITLESGASIEISDENFGRADQLGGVVEDLNRNAMKYDSGIFYPRGTFGGSFDDDSPYIFSIRVYDGGDEGYIDVGDYISITFNEPIDPESVNDDLDEGETVTGVAYSETGGVSVSSSGKVTIKGIASFDMGSVEDSGKFTSKLALSSTGKILTITLTSGSDIEITDEDFGDAAQIGGTVEDQDGDEMESDSSISDPTGTFGGEN